MRDEKTMAASQEMPQAAYGRSEVKKTLHKNFIRGMLISFVLHAVAVGSYYLGVYLTEEEEIPTVSVRILKYSDLGPPPSIAAIPPPPAVGVTTNVKPSIGVPVPVPDAEATADQTIATQAELSATPSPLIDQDGGGLSGGFQIEQDIVIEDDDPGMDTFIPVEKYPQVVKRVVPAYPDLALRAGLEGVVWVKILVGKDGHPQKAVVIKSSAELFNDPAAAAAMAFVFTPAVMNNGPVKVWVSIPFRFTLKDAM